MKHFINTEENEIWSEEDLKAYYESLKENGEWTANHMTFEEWLNDQEQFDECVE